MTYSEKLKDPRWQKKRLEIFNRDAWTCQNCFSKENPLAVHHRFYLRGLSPWEYDNSSLITLCSDCHSSEPTSRQEALDDLMEALMESHMTSYELGLVSQATRACTSAEEYGPILAIGRKDIMERVAK